jgi:CheY-like chemotaxis protein
MIVDDDEDIRVVSEMSLRRLGKWEVVLAGSGDEAVAKARREQPDVILLDVMMPDSDGPTAMIRLREEPATAAIPVIFLTARVQAREVERYLELGALGVIRKPFDVMTLPDEIRRLVEGS